MTMKLAGKAALVTGASSGIGKAAAITLAGEGADVALNYWTLPEAAEEAAGQIRALGRRAILQRVDVSDQDAVESMADNVVKELGRLDILVSSAVYSDREPFLTANMDGFRRTINVTMWGAFHAVRAAAKRMMDQGQGGSIVVVSSPQARVAHAGSMAYNMAKGAVDQMARTAALELAPHGIRVNIFYPGWTDTPGERKFFSEEMLQQASRQLPAGRLARPEEMARGILFLVDPESEYIIGSTLSMDGGSQLPWWSSRWRKQV
jgi:glucose 1-dehydrogenase